MLACETLPSTTNKLHEIFPQTAESHDDTDPKGYQLIKQISDSKFPIHLISSDLTKQNYAVKVFPQTTEDAQKYFINETRFASLKHQNIVNVIHHESEKEVTHNAETKTISYILLEYAPYGDLYDYIIKYKAHDDERLIRTYFRQLIEGIEHLHANGVAHLDLKPENVLLSADFNLKICDFDLSYMLGDAQTLGQGTEWYRAPELYKPTSSKSKSKPKSSSSKYQLEALYPADIYSAGIILFLLRNGGIYPHHEQKPIRDIDFEELLYKKNSEFWKKHCQINGMSASFYDSNFKDLFNGMTKRKPKDRLTIKKIKKSKWYNGPVYTAAELRDKMSNLIASKC